MLLKVIGLLIIGLALFLFGFYLGRRPSAQQLSTADDVVDTATLYGVLSGMCEEKYQAGMSGDTAKVEDLDKQMEQVNHEIDQIMSKYSSI